MWKCMYRIGWVEKFKSLRLCLGTFFFFLFLRTKKHKNVFGCWLFPRQVFGDCYESSVF